MFARLRQSEAQKRLKVMTHTTENKLTQSQSLKSSDAAALVTELPKNQSPGSSDSSECEWFSPAQVLRFETHHVRWVFEHYEIIQDGYWPRNSRVIDTDMRAPGYKHTAYFVTSACVLAEYSMRLDSCEEDGDVVLWFLSGRIDYKRAKKMGIRRDALDRMVERVLAYVSGYKKKTKYVKVDRRR